MLKQIYVIISFLRFFPHLLCVSISTNKRIFFEDTQCWIDYLIPSSLVKRKIFCIVWMLTFFPEYRNILYYRIPISRLFKFLAAPMPNCYIWTNNIGKGLFIHHGFSSVIAAESIGSNFYVNQQVTIGHTKDGAPTIGNNVKIHAGAIVVGPIIIGDNVIIGAGATVVHDIPANAVVVGPEAHIIKYRE